MDRGEKLDILAIGAHPDDVELGAGGILAKHVSLGKRVGILDLTLGELGTRGHAEIRTQEASEAARILKLSARENLGFMDGQFPNDSDHRRKVVRCLRKYCPDIVLTNAPQDRHPDHPRAARLTLEACFLSGLSKLETVLDGKPQAAWRPRQVFHYIQYQNLESSFIVDTSDFQEDKMKAVRAYKSQFHHSEYRTDEPSTIISDPYFLESVAQRAREMGHRIGTRFGEGLICAEHHDLKVDSLFDFL